MEARQDVLQRIVQGMADVQRAGDVRRRDDDGERLGRRVALERALGPEGAGAFPPRIEARFDGLGVEGLFEHEGGLPDRVGPYQPLMPD